jgi:gliding motility-associated-like protein
MLKMKQLQFIIYKRLLLVVSVFALFNLIAQEDCGNLDFEKGNLQNWTKSGDASIVNRQQEDYYGNFPLASSGNYAVQLGNKYNPVQYEPYYSKISRTITVNNDNKNLIYGYAIVLLGYPHIEEEASYVKLEITNSQDEVIPCTDYLVYAQSEIGNGFLKSTKNNESNYQGECCYPIYYQPWKMNAIDLSPFIGQTLTISISSDWCVFNVDWGYAYVDFYCSDAIFTPSYNCVSNQYFIETIEGFNSYSWTGSEILSGQGTNTISTNQDGSFSLVIPGPSEECPEVNLNYEFSKLNTPSPFETNFSYSNPTCENELVTFTNLSTAIIPIVNFTWDFGDGNLSNLVAPTHIYDSIGTYNVTLIVENNLSCFDTLVKPITIDSITPLNIGTDLVHCDDEWLQIKVNNPGEFSNFLWSTGETGQAIMTQDEGMYFVFSTDACANSDTIRVTEDPAFFGKIPNVFTPNSDNENPFYFIESEDVVMFDLEIMNRWGNRVFYSKDSNFQWNGNAGELPLEDGVYFYKLAYQLSCQQTPRFENGFITIVR